jgi:hypothetical protein
MPKRLPDYSVEDRDLHGNVRVYFRWRGQKNIRLHDVPWSEPFMEACQLALRGQAIPPPDGCARAPAEAHAGPAGHLALAVRPLCRVDAAQGFRSDLAKSLGLGRKPA